ncbi:MAG TPA: BamA/TamA family outer membrane protein [Vicinamibacterales bacterium]|nr:BamA/TamA family outer membrane protein [Vicinamibacterales bacterium]
MVSLGWLPVAVMLLATGQTAADQDVEVKSLDFAGVRHVEVSRLRAVLVTRASGWLPWAEKQIFDRVAFEADLKRVVAFYRDRGYREARVVSHDLNSTDDHGVRILITVDEGEPTLIERVALEGFEVLGDEAADLPGELSIGAGKPLDVTDIQASREHAVNALREQGHPAAVVKVQERDVADRRAIVTLVAEPGLRANYGEIEVTGAVRVSDDLIRRHLEYSVGEVFRASDLQQSQRVISRVELFDFVRVEAVNPDPKSDVIKTRVTVTEGKTRRITLSGGYGTEEKLRGEFNWKHVNFFGGGRTLGTQARYSSLSRGVRVQLGEPYFLTSRYSSRITGEWWYEDEPAYVVESKGGRMTVSRTFRPRRPPRRRQVETKLETTYLNEYENYRISEEALGDPASRDDLIALGLDPDTGEGEGTLSAVAVDLSHANVDNLFDVHSGYQLGLHFEAAGDVFGGSYTYYETTATARYYTTIPGRAVVAGRLRVSTFAGPDPIDQEVPFFKRYFLGGATSLRGWGRFEVSPLNETGATIGGLAALEVSGEVRFPILGRLGGVVFVDSGNAWTEAGALQIDSLRTNAGLGLRYLSPVGPIRFDYGYQLTPIDGLLVNGEPESRHWRVHFSIGQAF